MNHLQVSGAAALQQPGQEMLQPADGARLPERSSVAESHAAASSPSRPLPSFQSASEQLAAVGSGAARADDPWQWWHHVRALCGHSTKLGVLLVVPVTLTGACDVDRWLGEPVKAVLLPTAAFLTNRKGFPVLSRPHQDLLAKVFQHGIQVCVLSLKAYSTPLPAKSSRPRPRQGAW